MRLVSFAVMTYIFVIEFKACLLPLVFITLKVIHGSEFEKIPGSINKMHLTLYSVNILYFHKATWLCVNTIIGKGNS